jgi:hypothetical protein
LSDNSGSPSGDRDSAPHRRQSRLIPQASFRQCALNGLLAALVLEIDTIPKPDGLGMPSPIDSLEQNSIDFGSHSMMIENRSIYVRVQNTVNSHCI